LYRGPRWRDPRRHHRRRPVRRRRRQDAKSAAIFGRRLARADGIDVGRVDRDHVGLLDDALLDPLQLIAGARQRQNEREIGHVRDRGFGLANPNRFDEENIEARRFAKNRLARSRRDSAQRSCRGRGSDGGVRVKSQPRHPRLIAENRAARNFRRGVDRQNRDSVAHRREIGAQSVDQGRLSDAGRARDPDPHRRAHIPSEHRRKRPGRSPMIASAAFHQGNRPRQFHPISGPKPSGEIVER
jgi:hypothetical protein